MLPTDLFCRAAVYPSIARNGKLDTSALLAFSSLSATARALSLVSWDKCCSENLVHEFGTNVADEKNVRKKMRENRELLEAEVNYYLGYYSFWARNLKMSFLIYSISVLRHAPEDGDDKHFHLELHALSETVTERNLKADERIARDEMASILFGPTPLPDELCSARQKELKTFALPLTPLVAQQA
jgi:hypothetical protein